LGWYGTPLSPKKKKKKKKLTNDGSVGADIRCVARAQV
jgi:hypothetical protein